MAQKFLSSRDFTHLELLNIRFQLLAADPSSPAEGWAYWNSVAHELRVYDGTTWTGLGAGGSGITDVAVASANGLAGTSDHNATTPTLTLSTTITGLLKGNGTAISVASAADVPTPLTTKGDLFAFSSSATRLPIGVTNKMLLQVNSGATFGMDWVLADHTYISDFDTQVRTSRLDQMAAPTADVSMNSHKITNVTDPVSAQDAATKAYVDALSQGLDFKRSVRAISTTNVTLASAVENGDSFGGVTLATGDEVGLFGQSSAAENGFYVVNASGAPTRRNDADASGEISKGAIVFVEVGTNAGQLWVCTATGATPWVPGSSTSTWTQFAGAADIVAGAGLTKTGNTLDVGAGTGIVVNANDVAIDTAVVVRKAGPTNIGNGSSTSIAVTHSLSTQSPIVFIYDNSTNEQVECDVVANSTSQVTLTFATAPASNAYRVIVMG